MSSSAAAAGSGDGGGDVLAQAQGAIYSDGHVTATLRRPPFDEFCRRGGPPTRSLQRGRYEGLYGAAVAQRQKAESFETVAWPGGAALSADPCAGEMGTSGAVTVARRLLDDREEARRHRRGAGGNPPGSVRDVQLQLEPFSRSAAGKVIDVDLMRTPLALEKSMHLLVEFYLRTPHTPLCFTDPFRVWGYLWDRLRGIRTTWGPQLPLCATGFDNYRDDNNNRPLSSSALARESDRRMRWLEFTIAALSVAACYLCRTVEGCRSYVREKKNFLESIAQCFTDLAVWYRCGQRHRHAEFVSLLLILYGLKQESKAEDRSGFFNAVTVQMRDNTQCRVPELPGDSVNLSQVYQELERQPHLINTQPIRVAVKLINAWATGHWFQFFYLCRTERLTLLQRAFLFQSFTYARFRCVLDLVLPTNPVFPNLRWRNGIPLETLTDLLMMQEVGHTVEFLRTMGLGDQVDVQQGVLRLTVAPNSAAPCITLADIEDRCTDKVRLFFPTHAAFFGFHVWQEAFDRFPRAGLCGGRREVQQLRDATRQLREARMRLPQDGPAAAAAEAEAAAAVAALERELLRLPQCPVNLMELLEPYCPPYNDDVAALALTDLGAPDAVVFGALPRHREAMLLRNLARQNPAVAAQLLQTATAAGSSGDGGGVTRTAHEMLDAFEEESVATESDIFDDDAADRGLSSLPWEEEEQEEAEAGGQKGPEEGGEESADAVPVSVAESRALLDSLASDAAYTRIEEELQREEADRQAKHAEERRAKEQQLAALRERRRLQQLQEGQQPQTAAGEGSAPAQTPTTDDDDDEEGEGEESASTQPPPPPSAAATAVGAEGETQPAAEAAARKAPLPEPSTGAAPFKSLFAALPAVGPVVVTPLPDDHVRATTGTASCPNTPAVSTMPTVETPHSPTPQFGSAATAEPMPAFPATPPGAVKGTAPPSSSSSSRSGSSSRGASVRAAEHEVSLPLEETHSRGREGRFGTAAESAPGQHVSPSPGQVEFSHISSSPSSSDEPQSSQQQQQQQRAATSAPTSGAAGHLDFDARRVGVRRAFLSGRRLGEGLLAPLQPSAVGRKRPMDHAAAAAAASTAPSFFTDGFARVVADYLAAAGQLISGGARTQRALRYTLLCSTMSPSELLQWRRALFFGSEAATPAEQRRPSSSSFRHPTSAHSSFLVAEPTGTGGAAPWRGPRALLEEDEVARRVCVGFSVHAAAGTASDGAAAAAAMPAQRRRLEKGRGDGVWTRDDVGDGRWGGGGGDDRRRCLSAAWRGIERTMPREAAAAAGSDPTDLVDCLVDGGIASPRPAITTTSSSSSSSGSTRLRGLDGAAAVAALYQQVDGDVGHAAGAQPRDGDGDGGPLLEKLRTLGERAAAGLSSSRRPRRPVAAAAAAAADVDADDGTPLLVSNFVLLSTDDGACHGTPPAASTRAAVGELFRSPFGRAVAHAMLTAGSDSNNSNTTNGGSTGWEDWRLSLSCATASRVLMYVADGAGPNNGAPISCLRIRTQVRLFAAPASVIPTMPSAALSAPTTSLCPQMTPILCLEGSSDSSASASPFSPTQWSAALAAIDAVVRAAAAAEAVHCRYQRRSPQAGEGISAPLSPSSSSPPSSPAAEGADDGALPPARVPGLVVLVRMDGDDGRGDATLLRARGAVEAAVDTAWAQHRGGEGSGADSAAAATGTDAETLSWRLRPRSTAAPAATAAADRRGGKWAPRALTGAAAPRRSAAPDIRARRSCAGGAEARPAACPIAVVVVPVRGPAAALHTAAGEAAIQRALMEGTGALLRTYERRVAAVAEPAMMRRCARAVAAAQ